MRLNKINRVIYPIVCALLIAETTYLIVLHRRDQKARRLETTGVVESQTSAIDSRVQELSQRIQKKGAQPRPINAANTLTQVVEQPGDTLNPKPDDLKLSAHQIRVEKVLSDIDELLADDNELKAVELARSIMADPDPEIRSEAVGVFAWAGVKGLPELSKMLSDSDEDVAQEASDAWEDSLDDISDDAIKAQLLAAGIKTMTNEENADSAIMNFDSMEPNIAVPAIVEIILTGTPVAKEVALGHYEFYTSEDYTTPEAAQKWVANEMAENADHDAQQEMIIEDSL